MGGVGHALGGRAAAEETEDSLEDEGEGEGEGEEGEREEEYEREEAYDAHAGHRMLRCFFKSMSCYVSLNRH
jgi:hypothetical protein